MILSLLVISNVTFAEKSAAPTETVSENDPQTDSEKKTERLLGFSVLMWTLFGVLFLFLAAVIVLGGLRTRRIMRQPLPTVSPPDPLWHLKGRLPATGNDHPTGTAPEPTPNESSDQSSPEPPSDR